MKLKYIFVTGGVISGLGKGIVAASVGVILKKAGFNVAPVKCDMYLNLDAGTMNPFEHGEIFVTDDGEECDQDVGHYERFLHQDVKTQQYLTSGQIYWSVLHKERSLAYGGKCVETFPFIPDEVKKRLSLSANGADVLVVELGGTVGEYQNIVFLETARRIASQNPRDVCFIHLGYLPIPKALGEMKTKPMQQSIMSLNTVGIWPHIVICRAEKFIDKIRKEKIAVAAGLKPEAILSSPDINCVYESPLILEKQNLSGLIFEKLAIDAQKPNLGDWDKYISKIKTFKRKVKIAIVGKYYSSGNFSLEDSYISVTEALKHAAWKNETNIEIVWYDSEKGDKDGFAGLELVDGILVPQGWGSRGVEGKIKAVQFARERKIPYLGLCFGMQMAVIEFARNICGLSEANSTEVDPKTKHPVIHIMPDQASYLKKHQYGDTIRLGAWPCEVKKGTILESVYKTSKISERHRHRYEFNLVYHKDLEAKGLVISGISPDGKLVEAIELPKNIHPFFVGTQFHPEYKSRFLVPHPLFIEFIKAAKNKLTS